MTMIDVILALEGDDLYSGSRFFRAYFEHMSKTYMMIGLE